MAMDCRFKRTCLKYNTIDCNVTCYLFVLLHGTDGKGRFWATRNVPKKYDNCFKENLPIKDSNPKIYEAVMAYIDNVIDRVQSTNRGIYFCGGTGTGNTTTAVTILNEYLIARVRQHLRGEKKIEVNPVLFIGCQSFIISTMDSSEVQQICKVIVL
jgi:DNA replication protein DnaC